VKSHFKVVGKFTGAGFAPTEAAVTIDRESGIFSVRERRRRRVYSLHLSAVAQLVVWRLIEAEARERRDAKRRRK